MSKLFASVITWGWGGGALCGSLSIVLHARQFVYVCGMTLIGIWGAGVKISRVMADHHLVQLQPAAGF